jgi:hypothetical protein
MRLSKAFLPIGALTLALGVGGSVAEGAQRDGQNRSRQSEGHARQRPAAPQTPARAQRGTSEHASRAQGQRHEANQRVERRPNEFNRGNDRRGYAYRAYAAPRPRVEVVRPGFNRHYGPGLSAYFGIGSGFRYGAPYSGRVYGYVPAPVYGARIYYGDVRLQVRPREASVFVDGYYAGIVDDFDGVFQRLTLTVGPHEIEIEAPGLEPQVYNVLVDPARTVDVRGDLYPVQ